VDLFENQQHEDLVEIQHTTRLIMMSEQNNGER